MGTIYVKYVPFEENLADFFTKPLARVQFQEMSASIISSLLHSFLEPFGLRRSVGGMDLLDYRLYLYSLHMNSGQWTVDSGHVNVDVDG